MDRISIIIPVYNVQSYIEDCLHSVAAQTYQGNIECLLIDDCGNDESILLAQNFIQKTHLSNISFRIIHHKQNKGLSGARNTGINESTGDWIYFLDSDDKIIPECFELMMECVAKYQDTQLVIAGAYATNGKFQYMNYENRKLELPDYSDDTNWINYAFLKHEMLSMTAWNILLKKSFVLDNSLFFKEGITNEDEILHFQLANTANRIAILKRNTYIYVVRENSIVTSTDKIKSDRNWLILLDIMIDNICERNKKRQVASIFYFIKMRITYSSDPVLLRGLKNIMLKLIRHATIKQSAGLLIGYIAPLRKLNKYTDWSKALIGDVIL